MSLTATQEEAPFGLQSPQLDALDAIAERALALMAHMVWEANHRQDAAPTDPKVGGHPAANASSLHLATAIHLVARAPQDFWCGKPHMAPLDHCLHYLMGFFRHADGRWMDHSAMEAVMHRLRQFSTDGQAVFQSYHAASDPDSWRILPSGTVGIPPVNSGYLALAYQYLVDHQRTEASDIHFWSLLGDSEFREGSLMEAVTDFAERGLSKVTWIMDYNRQSLDGTRIIPREVFAGTDADRMRRTMEANGWQVLELAHGQKRLAAFSQAGGDALRKAFEQGFSDYEMQALLWKQDPGFLRAELLRVAPKAEALVKTLADQELLVLLNDLGGHDLRLILRAYEQARQADRPTFILAHTLKGWGLECRAMSGNHSAVPNQAEVERLLAAQGLDLSEPYQRQGHWSADGEELRFLQARQEVMRAGVEAEEQRSLATAEKHQQNLAEHLPLPDDFQINLSMMPIVHTQWMWGQVAGKLVRIGTHAAYAQAQTGEQKELSPSDQQWQAAGEWMLTMSPDVGTSTNINPAMDGKVYGDSQETNWEQELAWSERGRPQLFASHQPWTKHIRFEIAEAASMSATGSFGKAGAYFGCPLMPMMTVYDFFIKRALDQLYYNVYWRSSFLLVGTPSGVTLSAEGAQHSWKSDIQMPSLISWEPFFAKEMEWILADALQRHLAHDNEDREGVLVRAVTMGVQQKEMISRLQAQAQYKSADGNPLAAAEIWPKVREDVLAGGYWLVHHQGQEDYQPGDNVVTILAMGAMGVEAMRASDLLLERGIYANVLMCTSPDLLLGRFAERNQYQQLRKLGLDGTLHLVGTAGDHLDAADARLLAARTIPIVSVVDGEPGLLDNAGSILGVKQVSLGVKRFSKSGRPQEVFRYHGMDAESIVDACGQALAQATLGEVRLSPLAAQQLAQGETPQPKLDWRSLWPQS